MDICRFMLLKRAKGEARAQTHASKGLITRNQLGVNDLPACENQLLSCLER